MADDHSNADLVHVEHRDGVAVLTLSNGRVNPLSIELLRRLEAVVHGLGDETRAVVVTGGPKVFAAGADITQFVRPDSDPLEIADPATVRRIGVAFLSALEALAALPCPTIAAVSGVALGGGCELALACDLRIAAQDSRFGQPEILLGIIPGGGGTQRLARLIGPSRAKDLVFSGRTLGADEALRIGLVDRLVPAEQLLDEAVAWARTFATGPRHALALAKSSIDDGLDGTLGAGLRIEQDRFVDSFATPDAAIGIASFLADGPGVAAFD